MLKKLSFLILLTAICLAVNFVFITQHPATAPEVKSESDFTPTSNYTEVKDNGDGSKTMNILSYPKYYQDENNQWQESDNNIEPSSYPYADWVSEKGVWQLYAQNNGWYARKHLDQAISLKLDSMVLLNKDRTFQTIQTSEEASVPTPTVTDNTILWKDYMPGVDFKITRVEDQFKEETILTQQGRDQLTQYLKTNDIDPTDKDVAFIFQVKLANLDGNSQFTQEILVNNQPLNWPEQGIETTGPIYEDIDDKTASYFPEGFVRHEDYDLNNPDNQDPDLITQKLRRFFTQDNQKDYLVGAPVDWLTNVKEGAVVFNDSVVYQQGVSPDAGYTGCADNVLFSGSNALKNYGISTNMTIGHYTDFGEWIGRGVVRFDISGLPGGVTLTSATLSLYADSLYGASINVGAYKILKEWGEGVHNYAAATSGESCWSYAEYDTVAWTGCANDDTDAESTAQDSVAISASAQFYDWDILAAVNEWYGGASNYGVVILSTDAPSTYVVLDTLDNATTANRPKLTIVYTVPDTTPPVQSAHDPADSATITDATPTITLTLNEAGDCRAGTSEGDGDEGYAAMSDNVICSNTDSTHISCDIPDLGADGVKTVYISCQDTVGNADTSGTNTDLTYTLNKVFNDTATGDWNLGTTWNQTTCASSCTEGVDYPGASDTAVIDSHTVTLTDTRNVKDLTISGGTLTAGSQILNVYGTWLYSSGTFNANTGTVNFASTATGKQITTGAQPFSTLVFNGSGGGWTLQDNLTATNLTVTLGTLVDNAKTVTVNGNISIANAASLLTSTGTWIQGASGNVSNPHSSTQPIATLQIANSVTSTKTGDTYIKKIVLGTNAILQGSNPLYISPTANDFIDMGAGSSITGGKVDIRYQTGSLTQKAFSTSVAVSVGQTESVTLQMTGDWTVGNLSVVGYGPTTTTEAKAFVLDTNTHNLTVNGNLILGWDGQAGYYGKILFSSGTHTITGNVDVFGTTNTWGYFDLGSANISVGGNIDFTRATTELTGASTVTMNATTTGKTITTAGNSFSSLTFNGSGGGWTLQDNLTATNLTVTLGTLVDNAKTVTVNGNISFTNNNLLLSSTGTWIQGANGNMATLYNPLATFQVANGVTSTRIGSIMVKKLVLGTNAVLQGASGLAIYPTANDFIDMGAGASITSGAITIQGPTAGLTQKAFSTSGAVMITQGDTKTLQMTGDWTTGSLTIYGTSGNNTEARAMVLDTNTHNLTVNGNLLLGHSDVNYSNDYQAKILFSTGTHIVTGNISVDGQYTHGYFYFDSANVSIGGNIDFTYGTVTPTTSTVILNGTGVGGQSVTSAGALFNALTITNASAGGVTFADRLQTATLTDTTDASKLKFSAASAGSPHTITSALNLTGGASKITLAPSVAATPWYITAPSPTTATNVIVSYSNSTNHITPVTSTDGGNNVNWDFDLTPPVQSAWAPATTKVINTATPTITLTLDEAGDCRASTDDESYSAMSDNDNCSGDGTTSITCPISDLGEDGAKTVYISCQDTLLNKDTSGTNTDLAYTVDTANPTVTITSPTDGANLTNTSVSFDASASDTNLGSLIPDLDSSLVSWWRMDDVDGSGNPTDYIGSNNGTKYGDASQTANGKLGKGFTFDGTGDYVDFGDASDLYFVGQNFSGCAWIKQTQNARFTTIFGNDENDANGGWAFSTYTGGTGDLLFYSASSYATSTDSVIPTAGNWYHVCFNYLYLGSDNNNVTFYVGGINQGSIAGLSDISSATVNNFMFATDPRNPGNSENFNGDIDDVQIFNRALTADEITALYNGTAVSHSSTLSEAEHTYKVYAQDLAGNVGTSPAGVGVNTFTVDASAPNAATSLTWSESSPHNSTSITAEWTKSDSVDLANQKIQFYSDDSCITTSGSLIDLASSSDESYSFTAPDDGTYTYKVTSIDTATNETTSDCSSAMLVDTTPPTGSNISAITADSATQLSVMSDIALDAGAGLHATPYQFQETSGNSGATSSDYQASTTHTDTGLTPNTQYTYKVRAKDLLGNVSDYSSESSEYTLANVPTSLALTADSSTQLTATWSANSNPAGTEYYIENVTGSTNSDWITDLTWSSSGLICNTQYTFQVKARNTDLTETAYADTITATTSACASQITGGGASGTALSFLKPTPPLNGFMLQINSGALSSASQDVTLFIRGSTTTPRMSISNDPSFTNAVQESYNITKQWRLTDIQGPKTVYLKFFTNYGVPSDIITATIYYQKPNILTPIINIFNPQTPENPPGIPPIPPQPPVEETVTQQAPLSLQNIWNLLPTQAINQFVLSPVPQEIRDLAAKFPGLANTLQ